jgi:hypothetical protein
MDPRYPTSKVALDDQRRPATRSASATPAAQQDLGIQIEALSKAKGHKVFSEQVSNRIRTRPEFEKAPVSGASAQGS